MEETVMRQKSLPILFLFAAVLLGLYFLKGDKAGPKEVGKRSALLQGLEKDEPRELILRERSGIRYFRFVREGSRWRVVDPILDEANGALIRTILNSLAGMSKELVHAKKALTPGFLKECGLEEPKGWIEVRGERARVKLAIGGEDVVPGMAFVQINGDIYRAPLGLESLLKHNLDEVRNPYLFRNGFEGVTEVLLDRRSEEGGRLKIRLQSKGLGFEILEPIKARAGAFAVRGLLKRLLSVRADRFRSTQDMNQKLFEDPWLRVEVRGSLGVEKVMISDLFPSPKRNKLLGLPPNSSTVFGKREGRPYLLELDLKALGQSLVSPIESLIDQVLWTFDPVRAKRVHLRRPGGAQGFPSGTKDLPGFVLESNGELGGFRLLKPILVQGEAGPLSDLFQALKHLRVKSLLQGEEGKKALGLFQPPDLEIRLVPGPQVRAPEVRVALKMDGNRLLARRDGESLVFVVGVKAFPYLQKPWWTYVERIAFRLLGTQPVQELLLEKGGKTLVFRADPKKGWTRNGAPEPDFQETFDGIKRLRASRPLGPFEKVEKPPLLATLRFFGPRPSKSKMGKSLGVLRLFGQAKGDDPLLAHEEGSAILFELSKGRSRLLRTLLP
jgi:hypothetical protein